MATRRGRPRQRKKPRTGWSRRLAKTLAAALVSTLLGVSLLFLWGFQGEASGKRVVVNVVSEDPWNLGTQLAGEGVISSPWLFSAYMVVFSPASAVQEREHILRQGLSARSLTGRLKGLGTQGTSKTTLPEGWDHHEIGGRLEELEVCTAAAFRAAVLSPELSRELDLPLPSSEGWLFPATYEFALDSDPEVIVRRMVEEAQKRFEKLESEGVHSDHDMLGHSHASLVCLASMVEKETGRARERGRIARVFLNRLLSPGETAGQLQSDPTANYGCRLLGARVPTCVGWTGQVTPAMLRDAMNPYNTYRHQGLPPGPIGNPGEAAFRAVLQPTDGKERYFVADGNGGHVFSTSYGDHQRAVQALRQRRAK